MGEVRALSRSNLLFLLLSGAATGLSWVCYFKALETGRASQVAPLDKLSVAFVLLLSFVLLGEPLDAKTIAGGALIVAGAVIIAI